jgi:hypothetical protein
MSILNSSGLLYGSAFHPSQLFTSGRDGFAIIPGPTSFESSDNSDLAEVGDGVQFQRDSSRLATPRDVSQSTSGNRPLLAVDSGLYSLDFEVSNNHFLSTASYNFIGAGGVSFFARVNVESTDAGNSRTIMGSNDGSSNQRVVFRTGFSPQTVFSVLAFDASVNFFLAATTSTFTTGTWVNVCAVVNATNARIWFNNMTDASVEGTATNPGGTLPSGAQNMYVGRRWNNASDGFDGKMAFAFCGNWSLSETERLRLAAFANAL